MSRTRSLSKLIGPSGSQASVKATSFVGDASSLTGLPAGYADSDVASYILSNGISNIVSYASDPSVGSAGKVYYNTTLGLLKVSDGTAWFKVSAELATLSSISGTITKATAGNITITGTGFLGTNCTITFTIGANSYTVVKAADSDLTISNVAVPAGVYNSAIGSIVSITVTNSDTSTSNALTLAVLARPSVLSSISGTIYSGDAVNITLTGTGFLTASCVVTFTVGATEYTVTKTADNDTTISALAVPAGVYNSAGGTSVSITVTNSDQVTSGAVSTTILALPTGGTITSSGGYRYHTFTSSGTFAVPSGFSATADYLIVAGGAGGGSDRGGGGGAGGYISSSTTLSTSSNSVTVGGGGAGAPSGTSGGTGSQGGAGGTSSIFGTSATGGGGGGGCNPTYKYGTSGGSGGGGSHYNGAASGGSGTSGQGNSGGSGYEAGSAGGGGGKNSAGTNAQQNFGGAGGSGLAWLNGTTYAAGGGGGSRQTGASGGSGIGGNGSSGTNVAGGAAVASRGSGGGGGSEAAGGYAYGGSGSSGIVIIRYAV